MNFYPLEVGNQWIYQHQYGFDNPDIVREPQLRSDCLAEAVAYYLSQGESIDYIEDSLLIDGTTVEFDVRSDDGSVKRLSRRYSERDLSEAKKEGLLRYCIRNDFSNVQCDECREASREGDTPEAEALFTWCEDNLWQGASCKWAIALYCREKDGLPKALCEKGNTWCEEHPEDDICR